MIYVVILFIALAGVPCLTLILALIIDPCPMERTCPPPRSPLPPPKKPKEKEEVQR